MITANVQVAHKMHKFFHSKWLELERLERCHDCSSHEDKASDSMSAATNVLRWEAEAQTIINYLTKKQKNKLIKTTTSLVKMQ